ncbi:thioredoxin domain-containing protein 5 homolog [Drosophila ficusphila]|uniref:thioredoxin domain-containing protein 5 homolog n=1 Tax=Drosophila ficusphila TaxID=30025 RepID=UPI001C8A06A7|nr:thioredoxin domain-containing protein 5 homolog [Drosophila ficusphila]
MPKFSYILYLLVVLLVSKVNSEIPSSENRSSITNQAVKPRSLDDCTPGKVFSLAPENYYETTKSGIFFVKFYEPNCIGCRKVENIWTDLAQSLKLKRNICFAELNCQFAKLICKDYELRYEPNLVWLENGFKVRHYDGDQNFSDLKKFVNDMNRLNDTNSSAERIHFHFKLLELVL